MPDNAFVVRSREHGDNSEYDSHSSEEIIPDHYVKRLWRRKSPLIAVGSTAGSTITFTNKESSDRTVLFSSAEQGDRIVIKSGGYGEVGSEVARVDWAPGSGKALERSDMSLGNKKGSLKDLLKKGGPFSDSRVFIGPDGMEYKWKVVLGGSNPAFPDTTFRTLYAKDSKHPVATTERLLSRDGDSGDESYPLYISERGVKLQGYIIATLVILEKLQSS